MRTTVTIDDQLLADAKVAAVRAARSLSELVEDGLRLLLAKLGEPGVPPVLPTFGGSGLRPGVDLEDKDGLAMVLDENAGSHAAG